MNRLFGALFVCLISISCVRGEPISVTAISIVDGDTIDVGRDRYRMIGYDTPEVSTSPPHGLS